MAVIVAVLVPVWMGMWVIVLVGMRMSVIMHICVRMSMLASVWMIVIVGIVAYRRRLFTGLRIFWTLFH